MTERLKMINRWRMFGTAICFCIRLHHHIGKSSEFYILSIQGSLLIVNKIEIFLWKEISIFLESECSHIVQVNENAIYGNLVYNSIGDVMREIQLHKVYRHFKGKYYIVEDIAYNSETMKKMVVYRQLYGNRELFVRDLDMFLSEVDRKKYPNVLCKYRFEEVVHE